MASCTAIYGIGSWRREYRGKRQAELAEETLSLFYEARDAIKHIRHPFSYAGEGSTREESEKETEEEKKAFNQAYVVHERYNKYQDIFNKIHSLRYRFMTQFGIESAKPFQDLRQILSKIFTASQTLSGLWARQRSHFRTEEQENKHYEFRDKMEAIFWEGLADEDPINPKLDKCVSDIEKICRDIIQNKGTIHNTFKDHILPKLKEKFANKRMNAD